MLCRMLCRPRPWQGKVAAVVVGGTTVHKYEACAYYRCAVAAALNLLCYLRKARACSRSELTYPCVREQPNTNAEVMVPRSRPRLNRSSTLAQQSTAVGREKEKIVGEKEVAIDAKNANNWLGQTRLSGGS